MNAGNNGEENGGDKKWQYLQQLLLHLQLQQAFLSQKMIHPLLFDCKNHSKIGDRETEPGEKPGFLRFRHLKKFLIILRNS